MMYVIATERVAGGICEIFEAEEYEEELRFLKSWDFEGMDHLYYMLMKCLIFEWLLHL